MVKTTGGVKWVTRMVSWVPSCLLRHVQHRSRRIRRHLCSCKEISGSCGDLGTFIPLYVALSRQSVIHPVPALFGAGLANVVTGWTWDIPMCVQPMKTIATLALLDGLTRVQVTTAGIWMVRLYCTDDMIRNLATFLSYAYTFSFVVC